MWGFNGGKVWVALSLWEQVAVAPTHLPASDVGWDILVHSQKRVATPDLCNYTTALKVDLGRRGREATEPVFPAMSKWNELSLCVQGSNNVCTRRDSEEVCFSPRS